MELPDYETVLRRSDDTLLHDSHYKYNRFVAQLANCRFEHLAAELGAKHARDAAVL